VTAPAFLRIDEVIDIHRDQIDRYGGDDGLRDANALLSAIAMPQSGAGGEYFHRDLFEMAAAYLFHVVQNHPFVDGNKRTGLAAALVFLELNGVEVEADQDELAEFVLDIAQGKHDKAAIAEFLREHAG
jgi:death-on-curing protein